MAFDDNLRRRVRVVCCSHGASVTTITGYCNFARQVYKGRRKLHGEEMSLYAAALVERYVKLGLERKVLEAIRHDVFAISPPGRGM